MKRILITCALIILAASSCTYADSPKTNKPSQTNIKYQISNLKSQSSCPPDANDTQQTTQTDKIDEILSRMNQSTARLKTYQAEFHYLFIQDPELLDSQTLRKGKLYYKKDASGSKLRVTFNTLKQDDGDEENHIEHYIFDGVWLKKIDFQLEKANFFQQAPEEKPIDVFEFISHRFPLLGFTNTALLRKDFNITLIPSKDAKSSNFKGLKLTPTKDSIYKNEYSSISFWLDTGTFLPAKIAAKSTEGDIFDIQLLESKVNKKIKNAVFKLETPKHFSQNIAPLKDK